MHWELSLILHVALLIPQSSGSSGSRMFGNFVLLLHFGAEHGIQAGLCTWQTIAVSGAAPPFLGIVPILLPHPCHFCYLLFDTGSHIVQAGCVAKAHLELFSLKCLALQSHTITPNLSFLIPQVPDKAICLSTYVPER